MDRIRVAVIDDDGLIRDGLGAIIETHEDLEFVGSAADGESGVALCTSRQPDVSSWTSGCPCSMGWERRGALRSALLT